MHAAACRYVCAKSKERGLEICSRFGEGGATFRRSWSHARVCQISSLLSYMQSYAGGGGWLEGKGGGGGRPADGLYGVSQPLLGHTSGELPAGWASSVLQGRRTTTAKASTRLEASRRRRSGTCPLSRASLGASSLLAGPHPFYRARRTTTAVRSTHLGAACRRRRSRRTSLLGRG